MSAQTSKKVMIVTTGGTIASRVDAPMVKGSELVLAIPSLSDHAQIEVLEFSNIGSSKFTPDLWLSLGKFINKLFREDSSITGIVVTHGTDSMEETAFFLQHTIRDRRPLILTGSMRTSDEVSSDGPANLINAVRVACDVTSVAKGVLVVMNEKIYAPRDVWKSDNRNVNTFASRGQGFLGVVDPDVVRYFGDIPDVSDKVFFDIDHVEKLPAVDIVSDFTGLDPEILDYFAARKIDGLILQSFAGGRLSAGAKLGLEKLIDVMPVIIASKVPTGRIVGNPNPDFELIYARDLPANKARILLMLALGRGIDRTTIHSVFESY